MPKPSGEQPNRTDEILMRLNQESFLNEINEIKKDIRKTISLKELNKLFPNNSVRDGLRQLQMSEAEIRIAEGALDQVLKEHRGKLCESAVSMVTLVLKKDFVKGNDWSKEEVEEVLLETGMTEEEAGRYAKIFLDEVFGEMNDQEKGGVGEMV